MGHSKITVTFDSYCHLMPGNADEARELMDVYLERASAEARHAAVDLRVTSASSSASSRECRRTTKRDPEGQNTRPPP